ncbi:uncharacterized protein [Lolium perenne]|uniref:uncharacterized protein n=1 Tax=Lolium perenne TaxID=4522 RepID=UPI003A99C541
MATHWGLMQTACSKWHGIQEECEKRPISGHDMEQKLRRALDMYTDDTSLQFKFLNVYARLEKCEKWKEVRTTLSKSKTEQYNPDAPAATPHLGLICSDSFDQVLLLRRQNLSIKSFAAADIHPHCQPHPSPPASSAACPNSPCCLLQDLLRA